MKRLLMLLAIAAVSAAAFAATASADYGRGAVYQVELSANASGPNGGGVWLWIGLNADGGGDYSGSDCGHGLGASSDRGDVHWTTTNGLVTITGVVLNGLGGFPTTITVPATTGHYSGTIGSYLTLPAFIPSFIGTSQLQVAP